MVISFNMTETEIHNEDFALTLALKKELKLIHTLPIFIIPQYLIFKPEQLNCTLTLLWRLVNSLITPIRFTFYFKVVLL